MGLEPTTSPPTLLLQSEEVPFMLELMGARVIWSEGLIISIQGLKKSLVWIFTVQVIVSFLIMDENCNWILTVRPRNLLVEYRKDE